MEVLLPPEKYGAFGVNCKMCYFTGEKFLKLSLKLLKYWVTFYNKVN